MASLMRLRIVGLCQSVGPLRAATCLRAAAACAQPQGSTTCTARTQPGVVCARSYVGAGSQRSFMVSSVVSADDAKFGSGLFDNAGAGLGGDRGSMGPGSGLDIDDLFDSIHDDLDAPMMPTMSVTGERLADDEPEDDASTKSRWAHVDDFTERKMPPARMWRDKSNLGRLRRAGLAYTEDEVLANPDLRGLEAYQLRMVDAMNERDFRTMYGVYKEMVADGVEPDVRTFNILIEAAGRARRVDIIYKFAKHMQASSVRMDIDTANTLIRTLGRLGDMDSAIMIYKNVRNSVSHTNRHSKHPNIHTYSALIRASLANGRVETAFNYFNVMVREHHLPTEVHFQMLFRALFELRHWEYATQVFRTMMNFQRHFAPSLNMCKLLFTHFARGQLTARELFLTVQRWVKLHPTTPPTPRQMRRCIDKLVDEELYEDARRVTVLASRIASFTDDEKRQLHLYTRTLPEVFDEPEELPWGPDGEMLSDNDGPAPQVSPDDAWVEGTESEDDVDGHAGGYLAAGRRRRPASKSRKAADPTAAFGSPKRSGLRVKKKYQRGGSGYRPPSGVSN